MNMELGVGTAAPSAYSSSKVPRFAKPLTFDEKEALSDDINALPPEKLAHVVKIVQESMPLRGRHDDDEIEVDIETLDDFYNMGKFLRGQGINVIREGLFFVKSEGLSKARYFG